MKLKFIHSNNLTFQSNLIKSLKLQEICQFGVGNEGTFNLNKANS